MDTQFEGAFKRFRSSLYMTEWHRPAEIARDQQTVLYMQEHIRKAGSELLVADVRRAEGHTDVTVTPMTHDRGIDVHYVDRYRGWCIDQVAAAAPQNALSPARVRELIGTRAVTEEEMGSPIGSAAIYTLGHATASTWHLASKGLGGRPIELIDGMMLASRARILDLNVEDPKYLVR